MQHHLPIQHWAFWHAKPLAPDDHKIKPLPLSLNFGNAGVVIARNRWDEKTTLLQFRSVPFYSANHHHRDENCFTLHYKGPLIIDSGLYDEGGPNGGYGSIHWRNYFTRTIAHNGIIVFDPKQRYEIYGQEVSNDGGQTYRNEPTKLEDILPGGHAHLDGITHYQNTDEYTHMAGDATMVNQVIEYWKVELNKVLPNHPDLILLTEACDRPGGLTTKEQFNYFRVRKNQILDYFASVAKTNHCYIAFGMKREDNGTWWNSCVLLDREGQVAGIYNKNFPTIDEMKEIKAGNETPIFQCDFGKVVCAVCFDLNFDELRDQYATLKPDIILFPSLYHGGLEQSKWAYSCRAFFVCAFGFINAPSEIRNPLGEVVASSTNYFNYAVATVNLDRKLVHLDNNWSKLVEL